MSPASKVSLVSLLMGVKNEATASVTLGDVFADMCPRLKPTAKCASKPPAVSVPKTCVVPVKPKRAAKPRVSKAAASGTLVVPPPDELPAGAPPSNVVAPPLASPPVVAPPLTSPPAAAPSKKATPPKPKKAPRVSKAKAAVSSGPVEPGTPPPLASPVSGLASGAPTGPPLATPVSGLASDGPDAVNQFYKLNATERSELLGAASSKDIPVKLRNKLYSAMNRFLSSSKVTKSVVEKWAAAEGKGPHGKFEFLQNWARDTSGGSITVTETHEQTTEEAEDLQYVWLTKWDLYQAKNAFKHPEMRLYCDKLMASAKSRKHTDPKFRNDLDMRLFKVLGALVDSTRTGSKRSNAMTLSAAVDPTAHAAIIDLFAKPAAKPDDDDEKATKKIKMTINDQRVAKVKADLTAASVVVAAIASADDIHKKYLGPINDGIDMHVGNLKTMSHDIHDLMLHGASDDAVTTAWGTIITECLELKKHIDCAASMMYPGNYTPHTTPYDSTLSV